MELPYYLSMPLWYINSKDRKAVCEKEVYTPVFTASLFSAAKIWKQPKCPPEDECIKKMWNMYTVEYNQGLKGRRTICFVMLFQTWVNLKGLMLNEIRQVRKKNTRKLKILNSEKRKIKWWLREACK